MARGEGIKRLGDLFAKYQQTLRAPEASVCAVAAEVVHDVIGITVAATQFSYTPSSKLLTLKTKGPVKTEILLMKEEILVHLRGRLGPSNAPRDII
jgi:hypothetical protein